MSEDVGIKIVGVGDSERVQKPVTLTLMLRQGQNYAVHSKLLSCQSKLQQAQRRVIRMRRRLNADEMWRGWKSMM